MNDTLDTVTKPQLGQQYTATAYVRSDTNAAGFQSKAGRSSILI
jgi:hypothetical protein